jgi:phage tail sheath protein FI
MTTYSRPGVFIQEIDLPQTIDLPDNGNAVGGFVGTLSKGAVNVPVLLTSWIDFVKTFGGLSDAYPTTWAAYNFFANGGRNLYVKRVVGTGADYAEVTLVDRSTTPGIDTITVTAKNPGNWGTGIAIDIVAAGSSDRFGMIVSLSTGAVEQFTDLSMDPEDRRYVVSVLNTASAYVNVTDENSVTASPNNMPKITTSSAALTGSSLDGAAPGETEYIAALSTFDSIQNPIVFNAPDAAYLESTATAEDIQAALSAYTEDRGDAFAIIDIPAGLTVEAALSAVKANLGANATGANAAAYYPWLLIPNTLRATPGATRLQAPGAAMVGQYLATDASRGVFKAPAGIGNRLALAVTTEKQFTNTELDSLNTDSTPINAIRQIPGAGIVSMGGRTLLNTPNERYINVRRSLIYVKKELTDRSIFSVFENNDERLWSRIRTSLSAFLQSYWQQGGLRGATTKEAFFVRCDASINSFSDIQNGRLNIEVGVALEYPAEFVVIKLSQLTGSASA